MQNNINSILLDGEEIKWNDTPNLKQFLFSYIFNETFLFILAWTILAVASLVSMLLHHEFNYDILAICLLHAFMIISWIINMIIKVYEAKDTRYYLTNKRIIIQNKNNTYNIIDLNSITKALYYQNCSHEITKTSDIKLNIINEDEPLGLIGIHNGLNVYQLIENSL